MAVLTPPYVDLGGTSDYAILIGAINSMEDLLIPNLESIEVKHTILRLGTDQRDTSSRFFATPGHNKQTHLVLLVIICYVHL